MSRQRILGRALVAAAFATPACASESPTDPRAGEVVRTIQDFATADGDEACELLTEAALERIYNGLEGCVERSENFTRGEVKVESVSFSERGTLATAHARSLGGEERYTVIARLVAPPGCPYPCREARWQISEVRPQ